MKQTLIKKLEEYKRRLYLNRLLKGTLLSVIVILSLIYFGSLIEFSFAFDTVGRTILFFLFATAFLAMMIFWVIVPVLYLLRVFPPVSDEKASQEIGRFFPEVKDKLLNTIQLSKISREDSSLVEASIDKRMQELSIVPFAQAVDFSVNWKYARYLGVLLLVILISSLTFPSIFVDSTKRIVNFRTEYAPEAPFTFVIENEKLEAFRNEDFTLSVKMEGDLLPSDAYIRISQRSIKLEQLSASEYQFTFKKPHRTIPFTLEASGFSSGSYELAVFSRPEVKSFNIELQYPRHTGRAAEVLSNTGNLTIPEGTKATWQMSTAEANSVWVAFSQGDSIVAERDENLFEASRQFFKTTEYEIKGRNDYSHNKEKLIYQVTTLKDEYPVVINEYYADTILYEYIVVAGRISDDYGIRDVRLFADKPGDKLSVPVPFQTNGKDGSYYFKWNLDSLDLKDGERVELYLQVRDNDAINGYKQIKTPSFFFNLPSKEDLKNSLAEKSSNAESKLNQSIDEAQRLNEKIKELQNRLKSKKDLEWQEERLLEEILKQRERLEEQVKQLQQQFDDLKETENKFSERSEELQQKAEEIQKLMDEVLDEETRKLYEELQKLLEEQGETEDIQQMLDQMSMNEENLEQELERTLELFKRLKVETKLEQATEELKELAEEQEQLAQETQDEQNSMEDIQEQQDAIQEEFEELKEELDQIEQLNQELKSPEPLRDFSEDEQQIDEGMKKSQENLENNQRQQGSQQQQQTGQQMQQMAEKMEEMQAGMQMQMMQANMDDLRDIVDNLVKLSFKEEELIANFREVRQVDPRFVELSQDQLKLKDDAQVIQDSLLALAGRVPEISNFVTREVTEMNRNIDAALQELRERNRGKALSNQQFAMASMNNLSLLLSDALEQMQQMMAMQSGQSGKPQPNGQQSMGDLKKLQQQLSEQIKDLKESGQKGRKLSEQLARMAAQQEMIRNQLREFEKQLKGRPDGKEAGDQLGKIIEEMEKNEIDLVNKRLTQELINRQKDIQTRMLEAEESMRDQDFDNKREGETASEYTRDQPEIFEEYLKAREKEIELLKNVPLELSPFYIKEVNDYFRRLSRDN
ncbi:MAG: hypothetical protein AAGA85_02980 [Bacteroidota bacterium]